MKKFLTIVAIILLSGCYTHEADPPTVMTPTEDRSVCVDTRDGETFFIIRDTIGPARHEFGDVCLDAKDATGMTRTLCKSHESWLKCHHSRKDQS